MSMLPDRRSEVPVIYWVSDPNPARVQQIDGFHRWLAKDASRPACELRLDSANYDKSKKIIQAVSGVAGDIMDLYGGRSIMFFQTMGVLRDLTEDAVRMGFDVGKTYDAIGSEITVDGRQYAFPCNVSSLLYWINKSTFERYGCSIPQMRMTLQQFEAMGKEFVDAANPAGLPRTVFLCDRIDNEVLMRSLGLSTFNETQTRCTLDDERYVRTLELLHKWTFEDHLMPTPAERSSFSAESGYGGLTLQLFNSGNYAMVYMGRYALIQLREFEGLDLAICMPPHGGYPNVNTSTRAAAVYANSPNPECALHFMQYLASEDYNMQIVRDADALPPNPVYTEREAFLRPLPLLPNITEFLTYADHERAEAVTMFADAFYAVTDNLDRDEMMAAQDRGELMTFVQRLPIPPRPRGMADSIYEDGVLRFQEHYLSLIPKYQAEWSCHAVFTDTANTIAIGGVYSPFVPAASASREILAAVGKYNANLCTAEEASQLACNRVNEEIARTLHDTPSLQVLYEDRCAVQEQIAQLREAGDPVPLEWISNTFYRRYYVDQGWVE